MLDLDGLSATEQKALTAALKLFVEQGYFNTTVPQIVEAAGISTGSLYHHFGDKRTLAKTLLDRLVSGIEHQLREQTASATKPLDAIEAVIRWMLRQADEQPHLIRFLLYARHQEFLPDEPPVCSRQPFERMRALVAEAQQAGQLPQVDPVALSAQVFGPTFRIVQAAVDGVLPQPAQYYADELIQLMRQMRETKT